MGRGEQWGEGVRVGDLVKRAEFRARLTGDRGGEGVEDDLVLLLSVWGTVRRAGRPVGKYIKCHEVHHCYILIKH